MKTRAFFQVEYINNIFRVETNMVKKMLNGLPPCAQLGYMFSNLNAKLDKLEIE